MLLARLLLPYSVYRQAITQCDLKLAHYKINDTIQPFPRHPNVYKRTLSHPCHHLLTGKLSYVCLHPPHLTLLASLFTILRYVEDRLPFGTCFLPANALWDGFIFLVGFIFCASTFNLPLA